MTLALRALALSLLVTFLGASAYAAPKAAGADKASAYIEALGHKALDAISNKAASKDSKQKTLEDIFKNNVDFAWVSRFVTGRFWRTATPEQQGKFTGAYQAFLIKHYTSRFTEYTSGSFKITGAAEGAEPGEYVVNMQIMGNDASEAPILIDYKVRQDKAGYKVFDIIVEGVSLITTQRSEFASVLNSKGMDGLTEMLATKTAASTSAK